MRATPRRNQLRMLFAGDSLTTGDFPASGTDLSAFRGGVFAHSIVDGFSPLVFKGPTVGGPATINGVSFPRENAGTNGYHIDDYPPDNKFGLYPVIVSLLSTYPVDAGHLLIGGNDCINDILVAGAPARLELLIRRWLAATPNLRFLAVGMTPPTVNDTINARIASYVAAIPAICASLSTARTPVFSVDYHGAFLANASYKDEYLNNQPGDGVHLINAGNAVVADLLWTAIEPYVEALNP